MIRSHVFPSSNDAYDCAHTEVIHDGDVLLAPSEGWAAVVAGPWPVVVVPFGDKVETFGALPAGVTFENFQDGRYQQSAGVAIALHTASLVRAAGLGSTHIDRMLTIARELGWAGEIPEQERFAPNA